MKPTSVFGLLTVAAIIVPAAVQSARADDGPPPSLTDVHQLLQQAAGDSADTPPPADQQRTLLEKALKEMHHLPHVYHGALKQATQDVESAIGELAAGDQSHKARTDILEADDLIRQITD